MRLSTFDIFDRVGRLVSWRALSRKRLGRDDRGATTLEYALLLAAIAIPSYFISMLALDLLIAHYRMMTLLNSLPVP